MTIGEAAAWANVVFVAISVAIYTYLAVITRYYANTTQQILEASKTASYAQIYIWATERLSDPSRVKMRRMVIEELPKYDGSLNDVPDYLRNAFEETCRTYDLIGSAGRNGMFPLELIVRESGDSIIKTHKACEPFLKELRKDRGELFWDDFTELAKIAKENWK